MTQLPKVRGSTRPGQAQLHGEFVLAMRRRSASIGLLSGVRPTEGCSWATAGFTREDSEGMSCTALRSSPEMPGMARRVPGELLLRLSPL
jgi:hypothetical protein